jgi:hypothetical protein
MRPENRSQDNDKTAEDARDHPGWPGAHSQGETIDELLENLVEVIGMLLEDGEPSLESEFVGTQTLLSRPAFSGRSLGTLA